MTERPADDVWTFADFRPGLDLERVSVCLDEARLQIWSSIYGKPRRSDVVPSGVLVAAAMEAYLKAFKPRPAGNIHAGQKLIFSGRNVEPGTKLDITVSCLGKNLRKERRWVTFGVTVLDGADALLQGEIQTIWAK